MLSVSEISQDKAKSKNSKPKSFLLILTLTFDVWVMVKNYYWRRSPDLCLSITYP